MKLIIFNFFVGTVLCQQEIFNYPFDEYYNPSYYKRIIEGNSISIEKAPYQVSLERFYKHLCGGAIINSYFVITAAHCLIRVPYEDWVSELDLLVRAGTSVAGEGGTREEVELVRTPKNFQYSPPKNDIGLVKLRFPFKFSTVIKPIPLNSRKAKPGEIATITGYGSQHISYFRNNKHILMTVNVPILDISECRRIMKKLGFSISKGTVCAGYTDSHRDACQGDSGGPMTINGSLSGIISWGVGCGVKGRPGMYTDVSRHIRWIKKCRKSIMKGNKIC